MEPPFLVPGDRVALITPAYHTTQDTVDGAAAVLRAWGFEPVPGPNVGRAFRGDYAGTPAERLADLRWALEDSSIRAILCLRGGYGTVHFVGSLAPEEFAAHPKWLIGYSDITTLHGLSVRAGLCSIHGPMGVSLVKAGGKDPSSILLRDLLTGSIPAYSVPAHPLNRPGTASGPLVGGNLSTLVPLLGTPADMTAGEGFLLLIEEVEEDMSHIDRLLNILRLNGVFARCAGVILGEFTDCKANLAYDSVEQMVCTYLDRYPIPVCCGFPAGHDDENWPLLLGSPVTLDVTAGGASLGFGALPDD